MKVGKIKTALFLGNLIFSFLVSMIIIDVGEVWATPTKVLVDPKTSVAEPGESFVININISEVTDLMTYTVRIDFNSAILYSNSTMLKEGPFLNDSGPTTWTPSSDVGYVEGACELPSGIGASGSGTLFNATFQVLAKGKSNLALTVTSLMNKDWSDISYETEDGVFYTRSPKAVFTYRPEKENVLFNASESVDYNGYIVSYEWNFDDGTTATETDPMITHAYATGGTYNVTLTIIDNETLTDSTWREVSLATIYLDPSSKDVERGETFTIDINIAAVTNLSTWEFKLAWNPDIIRLNNPDLVQEGPFLKNVGPTSGLYKAFIPQFPASPREMIVGCMLLEPGVGATGSGTLANVTFWVKNDAKGHTVLDLFDTELLDPFVYPIAHASAGGFIKTRYPKASFMIDYVDRLRRNPIVNETLTFNATASYDPNGYIVNYEWNLGDGNIITGNYPVVTHTYTRNDTYIVSLTVTDSESLTDTVSETEDGKKAVVVDLHDIAIVEVKPDKTLAGPGAYVYVNVTIVNKGSVAESFNVTVYYMNTTGENTVIPFQYDPLLKMNMTLDLPSGANVTIQFTWNTTDVVWNITEVPESDYALWANASLIHPSLHTFVSDWETLQGDNMFVDGNVTLSSGIPVAHFSFTPSKPIVDERVVFNALRSKDGRPGRIVKYAWEFGDGKSENTTDPIATYIYNKTGTYRVKLTVYDDEGNTGTAQNTIIVGLHDLIITSVKVDPTKAEIGQRIEITVTIQNNGTFLEIFDVTVYYDENVIEKLKGLALSAKENATQVFTWSTAGVSSRNYIIKVFVAPVEGERNTINNVFVADIVTIEKRPSAISMSISKGTIKIGESVVINASLTPAMEKVNLTIYSSLNNGLWKNITISQTDSNGRLIYNWTPAEVGVYRVRASWVGDDSTLAAVSEIETLLVEKRLSTISLSVTPKAIQPGGRVFLNGSIIPEPDQANVTLSYSLEDGNWIDIITVELDADSKFLHTWTPAEVGVYRVRASWVGDDSTLAALSEIQILTVETGELISPPILYGGVAVALIAVAAIVIYLMRGRFRKS